MTRVEKVFDYVGCFPETAGYVDGVNGVEPGLLDGQLFCLDLGSLSRL